MSKYSAQSQVLRGPDYNASHRSQRKVLHVRDNLGYLDTFALPGGAIEKLNHAFGDFPSDGDAVRNANQISVFEFHTGAFIAIVKQNFQSGMLQILVEFLARFTKFLVLYVGYGDNYIKRRQRLWPDYSIGVVVLLNRGRDNAFHADAVAAHHDGDLFTILCQHSCAHRLGILRSEFEDVPDFHRFVNFQDTRLATRTRFTRRNCPQVSPLIHFDVPFNIDAANMMVVFVGAGRHVAATFQSQVSKDENVLISGARNLLCAAATKAARTCAQQVANFIWMRRM